MHTVSSMFKCEWGMWFTYYKFNTNILEGVANEFRLGAILGPSLHLRIRHNCVCFREFGSG